MKGLLVWTIRGIKVLVLLWILFPLFFGFKPLERIIAGFSLADLVLVGVVVLLVVSMVLYRIFVGPPVLTQEEEKEWEKRQEKEWKELEEWLNDSLNPRSPRYYPLPWDNPWDK